MRRRRYSLEEHKRSILIMLAVQIAVMGFVFYLLHVDIASMLWLSPILLAPSILSYYIHLTLVGWMPRQVHTAIDFVILSIKVLIVAGIVLPVLLIVVMSFPNTIIGLMVVGGCVVGGALLYERLRS